MKAKTEGEVLVKVGYRIPPNIKLRIEKSATEHRRSVNDEVIVLLEAALSIDDGPTSAAGLARLLEIREHLVGPSLSDEAELENLKKKSEKGETSSKSDKDRA